MGLRRRRASRESTSPITEFWTWWRADGADRVAAAIGTGGVPSTLVAQIAERVAAIDQELEWELAPGSRAAHLLCVSSGGTAQLRPIAERWRRAAPPDDATWEYAAARRPDPSATDQSLTIREHLIEIGETVLRVEVDDDRWRIHLGVSHPVFPAMTEVDRGLATFLMLDWLLGEDDVERWLGEITPLDTAPSDPVTADALPEIVAGAAARVGEGRWTLVEGRSSTGERVLASARCPLRWIDHPLLDRYHAVRVPSRSDLADGMPTSEALEELRALEESLVAGLGSRGLLVAHETTAGWRTLHVYTDFEDQNGADTIEGWVRARCAAGLAVEVTSELGPAWHQMRRFG